MATRTPLRNRMNVRIDGVHPARGRSAAPMIGRWAKLWRLPGKGRAVTILPGHQLRSSLATCDPTRGVIRVQPDVLQGPRPALDEILCHEFAHLAVHWIHGATVEPHGREWADLMRAAGYEPRVRLPGSTKRTDCIGTAPRPPRPRVRYVHRCPVCHSERLSPRPQSRWRCAACQQAGLEGELRIVSVRAPRGAAK